MHGFLLKVSDLMLRFTMEIAYRVALLMMVVQTLFTTVFMLEDDDSQSMLP